MTAETRTRSRLATALTMLAAFTAACGPSSKVPPTANSIRDASKSAAQPTLSLKVYPSKSTAQNHALTLAVPTFRAAEKVGADYPKPGYVWLIVDTQWARQPSYAPVAGASNSMVLGDLFFLLVNGETRCDPIEQWDDGVSDPGQSTATHRLSTRDLEIPAANAPPLAGRYAFQIPDHGVESLELVSSDAALGDIRLPLYGMRPTPAAPIAPPAHSGNVELGLLGVREVDMLGAAYPGTDSRYLIVDLRLRNLSASKIATLDPNSGWQVSDSIGDRYPVTVIESLSGRFLSPTSLLPAAAQRGVAVFTVPYHHYALTLNAVADDGSPLRVVLPETGTNAAPAAPPLAKIADGDTMTVSLLSVGRTGTLAPNLEPPDSVIDTAGGSGHANRYLILETQFDSSGATDTQITQDPFTLVHGSGEARTSSTDLNALPSQLGNSVQGIVPAHGTRRFYFAFAIGADWWDNLLIRYHGAKGDTDYPVAKLAAAPTPALANGAGTPLNVADSDIGGEIESLTATYGSGFTGRDLLRASAHDPWTPENGTQFPFDIALSFYNRASALISAVEFVLPDDPRSAPNQIEVWSSTASPTGPYSKLATATLVPTERVQRVSFAPVESRFVKVHVLSGNGGPFALELSGIRVLEAAGSGYVPLQQRFPQTADWTLSPRHAAQLGLDWLQASTIRWQIGHRCFGCHVQGQTAMGLVVAQRDEYVVSNPLIDRLVAYTTTQQLANGADRGALPVPDVPATILPTVFAAMSYSYLERGRSSAADAGLAAGAEWLLSQQAPSGEIVPEETHSPPIAQGSIMTSANAAFAFSEAFALTHDARYQAAADKAVAFIAGSEAVTTQDAVFKILALEHLGHAEQKSAAATIAAKLESQEDSEGGWKEAPDLEGPNPFATGQVLYALRQAGISVDSPPFRLGVEYLLRNQQPIGSWQPSATHSPSQTPYAPTMWAVIGLAGSFNAHKSEGEPPPTLERRFKAAVDSTGRFVLHINFDFDMATLRPDALPVIDQVAALLKHRADWQFDINGYTDNVGTDQHNQRLSEQRAQTVLNALVQRRVEGQRLASAGFGKGGAVATNDTEEGRFQNRRVEFVKR